MFSQEVEIKMGDSYTKSINLVRQGDIIMNKLNKKVKVSRVHIYQQHNVVGVQLNNGTGVFYTSPDIQVLSHQTNDNGSHMVEMNSLSTVHTNSYKLKNSLYYFSPDSDVLITLYDNSDPNLKKDLYCIHTIDSTQTYLVNDIIVCCNKE